MPGVLDPALWYSDLNPPVRGDRLSPHNLGVELTFLVASLLELKLCILRNL